MSIYVGLIVSIFLFSKIARGKYNVLVCGLLILIGGLRSSTVGTDTNAYLTIFKNINEYVLNIHMQDILNIEIGYLLLNKIINLFTKDERLFLLTISFIMIYLVQNVLLKRSKYLWLSYYLFIVLGFIANYLNIMRQFLAMGIMWNSLTAIEMRKLKVFLIYLITAFFFHKTAIIFIILYCIYPIKINKKYICVYILLILLSVVFLDKLSFWLIEVIPKYRCYTNYIGLKRGLNLFIFYFIISIFVYSFYLKKKYTLENKIYVHMLFLATIFQGTAYNFGLMTRLTIYFTFSLLIILPNIVYSIRNKFFKKMSIICLIIFGLLFLCITLRNDTSKILPYLFYFQ